MRIQQAINHLHEVQQRERDFVTESYDELLEKAAGLSSTKDALGRARENEPYINDSTRPRLSHDILDSAYYDAIRLKESKKSPRRALAFISEVVLPMTGIVPTGEAVRGRLIDDSFGACQSVEEYFHHSLTQINTGRYRGQSNISVYHDAEGTPIALRKRRDVSSALTLRPLAFEETEIPAGHIVNLARSMSAIETGHRFGKRADLRTFLVDEPLAVCLGRLSPWAYDDPLDRSLYALEGWRGNIYDQERGRIVVGRTLDDFRQAADRVMEMCGVDSR